MPRGSGDGSGRRNENHVKYKFKSALEYSTVNFSGNYISVADLRRQIIQDNRLVQNPDYMLQITNQDTKHVYDGSEQTLIPPNTHLKILRIPIAEPAASVPETSKKRKVEERYQNLDEVATGAENQALWTSTNYNYEYDQEYPYADYGSYNYGEGYYYNYNADSAGQGQPMAAQYNVANSNLTEIPKISYSDKKGNILPSTYRCYKCNHQGHWLRDCPLRTPSVDLPELTHAASNLVEIPSASTATRPIVARTRRSISSSEQTESRPNNAKASESQPKTTLSDHQQPSSNYRCYRCQVPGHWLRDCPLAKQLVEETGYLPNRTTGIPRSSLVYVDDANFKGAMLTPEGRFAVPALNLAAYRKSE